MSVDLVSATVSSVWALEIFFVVMCLFEIPAIIRRALERSK